MATAYLQDTVALNDMERNTQSIVKVIDGNDGYESGDVIFLGVIPRECLVTDIRIITEGDVLDATFDLGFVGDYPDISIVPIETDIQVVGNGTTVISMPISGVFNPDGSPYTGDRGSIWAGASGTNIGIKFNGAVTKGVSKIILTYSYYGTKDGKYGAATLPMRPIRGKGGSTPV